jgi:hypothetical protein
MNQKLFETAVIYALLGIVAFILTPLILWSNTSLFIMLLIATEVVSAGAIIVWVSTWIDVPFWSKAWLVMALLLSVLLYYLLLPIGYAVWTGLVTSALLVECFALYCQHMIDTGH